MPDTLTNKWKQLTIDKWQTNENSWLLIWTKNPERSTNDKTVNTEMGVITASIKGRNCNTNYNAETWQQTFFSSTYAWYVSQSDMFLHNFTQFSTQYVIKPS